MKKLLLGLLALLILGGGGAGAYFYFQKPAEAAVGDAEEHQAAKEAEKDDGHGGKEGGDFVELSPLVLPIIDDTGVTQVVSIVVVIEAASANAANDIRKFEPRLNDAYIQEMYGILNKHAALQGGVVRVDMLKERLNAISQRVLGTEMVNDVLLQVIQQRPL
jgi:flagellar FliL protein